jgi:hypothetical protein
VFAVIEWRGLFAFATINKTARGYLLCEKISQRFGSKFISALPPGTPISG